MMAVAVIFSICVHEYCHARVALAMGDTTAANRGHLTLNPLKQMGIISLLMFLFIGFAWGAVPVDERMLRSRYKWGPFATSLAGPGANFVLGLTAWILFGCILVFIKTSQESAEIWMRTATFIYLFGMMNIVMFLFNLIPLPGLDGWNAMAYFFPRIRTVNSEVVNGVMLFMIVAVFIFIKYIFSFAESVMHYSPEFMKWISGS